MFNYYNVFGCHDLQRHLKVEERVMFVTYSYCYDSLFLSLDVHVAVQIIFIAAPL